MAMSESETTKNTLYQLEEKMEREHWGDIQFFEEKENRYSIAVGKATLLIKELEQYRAIGTVEELKALKEKNAPKELDEHNFQDEVHHYLCPSCRSIVSYNQNYCDECGQALET